MAGPASGSVRLIGLVCTNPQSDQGDDGQKDHGQGKGHDPLPGPIEIQRDDKKAEGGHQLVGDAENHPGQGRHPPPDDSDGGADEDEAQPCDCREMVTRQDQALTVMRMGSLRPKRSLWRTVWAVKGVRDKKSPAGARRLLKLPQEGERMLTS